MARQAWQSVAAISNRTARKLDAQGSSEVKNKIRALIGKDRNKLVVDMAKVNYMDSSGLSVLVFGALDWNRRENRKVVEELIEKAKIDKSSS